MTGTQYGFLGIPFLLAGLVVVIMVLVKRRNVEPFTLTLLLTTGICMLLTGSLIVYKGNELKDKILGVSWEEKEENVR